VQRHDVEHLDRRPVLDDQPLDDVDAVQLRLGRGHRGEIPASGRSGPARPGAAVQSTPAPKDAVDGPHRGRRGQALSQQRLTDGVRADRSQIAVGQLASDLQNQILRGGVRAPGLVRHGRAVRPIRAIQALPFGALDPVGHRSHPNAEPAGDGTQGLAAADGGYHGTTPLGLTLCLLMRLPRHGAVSGKL
jgi:hypothetical protein